VGDRIDELVIKVVSLDPDVRTIDVESSNGSACLPADLRSRYVDIDRVNGLHRGDVDIMLFLAIHDRGKVFLG
jgi:hypothetical protein